MEDRIFQLLVENDDIAWKDIIFNLVKTEQMDPWDIKIGQLAKKYIELLKKAKDLDFKISGKVVLAASILLRMKSKRLVGEDLDEFDRLLAGNTVDEDEFYDELATMRDASQISEEERMNLVPRTPQPRKRKVSVYDLVNALEKALEVKKRRIIIIVASIAVVVSLFAGLSVAFSQIWNAIYDIKEELQTKATRYVIEGTFNVTQDGDLIRLYQIGTHTDSLEPNWMPGPSGNAGVDRARPMAATTEPPDTKGPSF